MYHIVGYFDRVQLLWVVDLYHFVGLKLADIYTIELIFVQFSLFGSENCKNWTTQEFRTIW